MWTWQANISAPCSGDGVLLSCVQRCVEAADGEKLYCKREPGNCPDPFAVAVMWLAVSVSHVPKKISSLCSKFLRRGVQSSAK